MDSDDEPIVFKRSSVNNVGSKNNVSRESETKDEHGVSQPPNSGTSVQSTGQDTIEATEEDDHASENELDDSSDSEDDVPIGLRIQANDDARAKKRPSEQGPSAVAVKKKAKPTDESESEDDVPLAQLAQSARNQRKKDNKEEGRFSLVPPKKEGPQKKKPVAEKSKSEEGERKWTTLQHNGVIFPPAYTPHGIKLLYKGKPVNLTPEQEEVATMYAVMRETEYADKPIFRKNFWNDWKEYLGPDHVIQNLDDCDFTPIWEWHAAEREKKKHMTTEEKKKMREEKLKQEEKYMYAIVDGVKEKVGNFRVEPPGLFRGRGEHPKMGKLKKRILPEDITINVGREAPVPECPVPGHHWKEVRTDRSVTWLAYWNDPINPKEFKYVFLAASSALKGQSDREKYEKARKLKTFIVNIRKTYTKNFDSVDMTKKQIAVATYLIDRLALRAGNEKEEDEADTVGCCSLKVEHVELIHPRSIQFDFLGKDSIRYFNTVEVEPRVYKAIGEFKKGKKKGDDLFDKLDTTKLNAHLKEIMPGLTAKVFRTYNASITLDSLLQDTVGQTVTERVADYQRANKEVAILCNHQRSVSKGHAGQMEKLSGKMESLKSSLEEMEKDLELIKAGKSLQAKEGAKRQSAEGLEKKIKSTKGRIEKMELEMAVKEDLKTVALGTSKINYMDPRITIAWCKQQEIPIEKLFNKSLIAKFAWAMDVEPDYRF